MDDYPDACSSFSEKGYAVVPGFASNEQVDGLRRRMTELIETFDPKKDSTLNVFTTNEQVCLARGREGGREGASER